VPFADVAIALLCGFVGQFLRLPIIILVRFSVFFLVLVCFPCSGFFFFWYIYATVSFDCASFCLFFEILLPVLSSVALWFGLPETTGRTGVGLFFFSFRFCEACVLLAMGVNQ
jgi:hypothetical protein